MTSSPRASGRSALMSKVRQANTSPELAVRTVLHRLGYRYVLHAKQLPGRPDLVFPSRRKVIFVHGCFWHRHCCRHGRIRAKTNVAFWQNKLDQNKLRDRRKACALRAEGWKVLEVWECQVRRGSWLTRALTILES